MKNVWSESRHNYCPSEPLAYWVTVSPRWIDYLFNIWPITNNENVSSKQKNIYVQFREVSWLSDWLTSKMWFCCFQFSSCSVSLQWDTQKQKYYTRNKTELPSGTNTAKVSPLIGNELPWLILTSLQKQRQYVLASQITMTCQQIKIVNLLN